MRPSATEDYHLLPPWPQLISTDALDRTIDAGPEEVLCGQATLPFTSCVFGAIVVLAACWTGAVVHGQLAFEAFEVDHPAIGYRRDAPTDAVARLNQRLETGEQQLRFDGASGYLRSLLAALAIPVESQMAVYSQTSLQRARINAQNPRVIFFNDSTAVAWVPGGFIEVASHDPRQGAVFYTLQQIPAAVPQLVREDRCLTCHLSSAAEGIPGFFIRSIPTAVGGATMPWLGNITTDHLYTATGAMGRMVRDRQPGAGAAPR